MKGGVFILIPWKTGRFCRGPSRFARVIASGDGYIAALPTKQSPTATRRLLRAKNRRPRNDKFKSAMTNEGRFVQGYADLGKTVSFWQLQNDKMASATTNCKHSGSNLEIQTMFIRS
jgi:hypothetical protein